MNILKWLTNKTGKLPISFAQAAGITAVVGAAGFAAMSYLSSPADTTNSFIPPSAYEQSGDVVYVSQGGGGGQYESNGEVGSTFRAKQSDSIRLANQQFERESQARALEEADVQPAYAGDESVQLPKAYQIGAGDVGLGMGGNADKQLNGSLDMFSSLQNQLSGVGDAINKAQAQGAGQQGAAKGDKAASGQGAATLAAASRNWGQGGATHAGSGSGVSNTFSIQDSGKNKQDNKDSAAAMAQVGDAMAEAQAAMKKMSEGTRMRSRANFGQSDGMGLDRDAAGQGARRRYGNAKGELEWIRKQSAEIAKNNTNSANEGGRPFLASAKISGGLVVSGENVTTGQGASSSDFSSLHGATGRSLRGISAGLSGVQNDLEKRTKKRHELRKWMWWALPLTLLMLPIIGRLMTIARLFSAIPWISWPARILAYILAAVTFIPIYKLIESSISYAKSYGGDAYSTFAGILGGMLGVGVGLSLFVPAIGSWLGKLGNWVFGAAAGIGFGGAGTYHFLSQHGDGYTDEELDDNLTKGEADERAEQLRSENKEGAEK